MKPNYAKIEGKWQMTESENFDTFMAALGVGYVVRKLGNSSKPLVTITSVDKTADKMTMKQESLVKTSQIDFQLGVEFNETTADGRQVKSTISLEPGKDNVLKHEMKATKPAEKDSTCWRYFDDKTMKCVCTVDDIKTTRTYQRV